MFGVGKRVWFSLWGCMAVAVLWAAAASCGDEDGSGLDSGVPSDAGGDGGVDAARDLTRCGTGNEPCGTCHGSVQDPAPPPDTAGRTATSEVTVGAHATHLSPSSLRDAVPCAECHRVPSAVLDLGHCDSPAPAEVTFGSLARTEGTFPIWNRTAGNCSMVYCHGATLTGGSNPTPDWTSSGTVVCGSCHDENHHGLTECSCHLSVWSNGQIINPSLHINGRVDM